MVLVGGETGAKLELFQGRGSFDEQNPKMDKIRALFSIFKKGQGRPPTSTHTTNPPLLVACLEKDEDWRIFIIYITKINVRVPHFVFIAINLHWRKPTSDSSSQISTCTPLVRECTILMLQQKISTPLQNDLR